MAASECRTFKSAAKEAKKRLKTGFWDGYRNDMKKGIEKAKEEGISVTKVEQYYQAKIQSEIRGLKEEDEIFYQKVRNMLISDGEVIDAIGRLTDKEYYNSLDYSHKQRYILSLSEKYLKALSRFHEEIQYEGLK